MSENTRSAVLPIDRRTFIAGAGSLAALTLGVGPVLAQAPAADVAVIENRAQIAHTAFCWWRTDVPAEVSYDYWRDVHGLVAARVPGLWQYRQLQIGPNRQDLWPAIPGVSFENRMDRQPQGMPQGLFLTAEHLKAFGDNPVVGTHIFNDERNFVARLGTQMSPPGRARTFVDRVGRPQLQGEPPYPSFAVCFVPRDGVGIEAFHSFLADQVARPWAANAGVTRLRLQPLERYDINAWNSPGIDHRWPAEREYWGYIELSIREPQVAAALLGSSFDGTAFARHVEAVHSYPIDAVYTIVQGGRPTEVGLRGYPAVRTIEQAGADNQRNPELLRVLYGDAVLGIERLR
jgi:hypothetical protein